MGRSKPREPGHNATRAQRQAYMNKLEQWEAEQARAREQREQSFPDNGTVGGQPGHVKQSGDRTVGYHGEGKVGKIVSNDGRNASFVRDDSGEVYVDEAKDNPYEPYQHRKHR